MYHRGKNKRYGVLTETVSIAFFYLDELVAVHMEAKLPHKHESLFIAYYFYFRPAQKYLLYARGMVRFKVVDYKVVELAPVKHMVYVFKQLPAGGPVDGVEKHRFFIK